MCKGVRVFYGMNISGRGQSASHLAHEGCGQKPKVCMEEHVGGTWNGLLTMVVNSRELLACRRWGCKNAAIASGGYPRVRSMRMA